MVFFILGALPAVAGVKKLPGQDVKALPNGNLVIAYPDYESGTGQVTVCDPFGNIISTLTGDLAGDRIGSGGIIVLANGNFVINSPAFGSALAEGNGSKGAVTWGNQTTGVSGEVSLENSVITGTNSTTTKVTALSTGRYVIAIPSWHTAGTQNMGAVTLCEGTGPVSRTVSAENSLVGSQAGDYVGDHGVMEVADGNYVVSSRLWRHGLVEKAGAVTWCHGTNGLTGPVTAMNSLVGSSAADQVGEIVVLKNGHYVVVSSYWDRGAMPDAGAITWGDGDQGVSGPVSPENSLVGDSPEDLLGSAGRSKTVFTLADGDYVVSSPKCDNGSIVNAGAVTWCPGSGGAVGSVAEAVTLKGGNADDEVGYEIIREVGGENYVVTIPNWNGHRGAVTWINGQTGLRGVVSAQNSLVGGSAGNSVGSAGVRVLKNGNYLVLSPFWDNGSAADAGAVSWGSGIAGIAGTVSAVNSLVGSSTRDYIGVISVPNIVDNIGTGVVITQPSAPLIPVIDLPNGNYVVVCPNWDNGSLGNAGAAVWGDGTQGVKGAISASNALVGMSAGQRMGNVKALSNSHYVVSSPGWRNAAGLQVGAFTWCDGGVGRRGAVTAANSLTGRESARVSDGEVIALTNGHYVVVNDKWADISNPMPGAVTWCDGTRERVGVISPENSLTGPKVGSGGIIPLLPHGDYLVLSPDWSLPTQEGGTALLKAGAVTWCKGDRETRTEVQAVNSVHGYLADQAFGTQSQILADGSCVIRIGGSASPERGIAWLIGTGPQSGDARQFSLALDNLTPNYLLLDNTGHGSLVIWDSAIKQITVVTRDPALNESSQGLSSGADTLIVRGHGFSLVPGENQILFEGGVTGQVTASTSTELTITRLSGLLPGPLRASLVGSSSVPVQVAAIYDPLPGSVSFSSAEWRVGREFSEVFLTVVREGGGLPCRVTLQSLNGVTQSNPPFSPARASIDYLSPIPAVLEFAEGELVKTVRIVLLPQKNAAGPNKHFKVRLIAPTDGVVTGSHAESTVRILTDDVQPPTLKLLTSLKDVSSALPWHISGVAGDARGIDRVVVSVNDGPLVTASLGSSSRPASVPFAADLTFDPDPENVITIHAYDLTGNRTTLSAQFAFTPRQRLTVQRIVPESFGLTPDKAAKFTLTATPVKAASGLKSDAANRDPLTSDILPGTSVTLRAMPLAENGFEQWQGLPGNAVVDGAVVHFVMPGTPVNIIATFSGNPFIPPAGRGVVFHGLLHAMQGTDRTNETEGWVTGTMVIKTGAFSGRIMIGGVNQPVIALFQRDGTSLFRVGKVQVEELVFGSRRLSLSYNATTAQDAITATIIGSAGSSQGTASRTYYDGKQRKVSAGLLNSTTAGFYTMALPAREQPGFLTTEYPQGDGYSTVKLTNTGVVTYAGVLADGTSVTAGSAMTGASSVPLFIPLTTPGSATSIKGGSFGGVIGFVSGTSDNLTAPELLWFRPAVTERVKPATGALATHLYTNGWPEGLLLSGYGALYDVKKPVQTTLGLGAVNTAAGNALLMLDGGRLNSPVELSSFNIQVSKVTKIPVSDKSYTLSLSPVRGTFSGTFTPDWSGAAKKLPAFKGVLIQQGSMSGGHGFFISNAEGDSDPESGIVELGAP